AMLGACVEAVQRAVSAGDRGASGESGIASACGGGALTDAAEYDVEVHAHFPATAMVSGFVLSPADAAAEAEGSADVVGVDTRQEGLALPPIEEGAGRVDVRVATS